MILPHAKTSGLLLQEVVEGLKELTILLKDGAVGVVHWSAPDAPPVIVTGRLVGYATVLDGSESKTYQVIQIPNSPSK